MTEEQIKAIRLGEPTSFQRRLVDQVASRYPVEGLSDDISAEISWSFTYSRWTYTVRQHPEYQQPGPFPDAESALEALRVWLRKNKLNS